MPSPMPSIPKHLPSALSLLGLGSGGDKSKNTYHVPAMEKSNIYMEAAFPKVH